MKSLLTEGCQPIDCVRNKRVKFVLDAYIGRTLVSLQRSISNTQSVSIARLDNAVHSWPTMVSKTMNRIGVCLSPENSCWLDNKQCSCIISCGTTCTLDSESNRSSVSACGTWESSPLKALQTSVCSMLLRTWAHWGWQQAAQPLGKSLQVVPRERQIFSLGRAWRERMTGVCHMWAEIKSLNMRQVTALIAKLKDP